MLLAVESSEDRRAGPVFYSVVLTFGVRGLTVSTVYSEFVDPLGVWVSSPLEAVEYVTIYHDYNIRYSKIRVPNVYSKNSLIYEFRSSFNGYHLPRRRCNCVVLNILNRR